MRELVKKLRGGALRIARGASRAGFMWTASFNCQWWLESLSSSTQRASLPSTFTRVTES